MSQATWRSFLPPPSDQLARGLAGICDPAVRASLQGAHGRVQEAQQVAQLHGLGMLRPSGGGVAPGVGGGSGPGGGTPAMPANPVGPPPNSDPPPSPPPPDPPPPSPPPPTPPGGNDTSGGQDQNCSSRSGLGGKAPGSAGACMSPPCTNSCGLKSPRNDTAIPGPPICCTCLANAGRKAPPGYVCPA